MRILLTNDDGIHARGLEVLERIARRFSDDVWTVAPIAEQSGKSRALTLTEPLRLRRFGDRRFAVTGTPTDAVMMALAQLMPDHKPDLILSGVNRGANLGEDVSYSGTVAGAIEGALAGIKSVALSQRYAATGLGDRVTFEAAEAWGERALQPLIAAEWAPRTLFNINFPPVLPEQVAGIAVVAQGMRDYGRLKIDRRTDPRGFDYFWYSLGRIDHTPVVDTDLEAIERNLVTVTPLHLDMTHRESLATTAALYG